MNLQDKTILVAGGSGLLGRAICMELARAGARVILTYKDHHPSVFDVYSWNTPVDGTIRFDITDPLSVKALVEKLGQYNGLDGFVNCIGINDPGPFDQITPEEFARIQEVNLTGSFRLAQALLPLVRDGGSVVFIGSVSAFIGGPTSTHYCTSKLGLVGLAQNLALFAASHQIRVNVVAPGYIASEMATRGQESPQVRQKVQSIPLGRLGTPEDVTGAVMFLLSDAAAYVTGTTLHVNGGLYFG